MGIIVAVLVIGLVGGTLMFLRFLGWFRSRSQLVSVEALCPSLLETNGGDFPKIEWLGHSSYRVEWGGRTLLLDPVLSARVSIAPRLCDLPPGNPLAGVQEVLVSHAHMDHMDNATLGKLESCDLYFPRKSDRFLKRDVRELHRLRPFEMGETFELGSLQVTVVPARHGGWRYPWQLGYFACGFVISDGRTTLYYAGDTAWGNHIQEIGERFRPDIAILPIGGYSPRWFLKSRHLNPAEAARAAGILGAGTVIPGHFGTYRVSQEPIEEPLEWFRREMLNR